MDKAPSPTPSGLADFLHIVFSRSYCCTQYDRLLASYCRLSVRLSATLCTVAAAIWTSEYELALRNTILQLLTPKIDPILLSNSLSPKVRNFAYLLYRMIILFRLMRIAIIEFVVVMTDVRSAISQRHPRLLLHFCYPSLPYSMDWMFMPITCTHDKPTQPLSVAVQEIRSLPSGGYSTFTENDVTWRMVYIGLGCSSGVVILFPV